MVWLVRYRDKDGKQKEDVFEASSRKDLFASLDTRGISVISLCENVGKAKIRRPKIYNTMYSKAFLFVVATIIGFTVMLVGVYNMRTRARRTPSKVATNTATPSSSSASHPIPINDLKVPASTALPTKVVDEVEILSRIVTTNSSNAIIERCVLADGKRILKVRPPAPIFENASDQVIAMAISVKPGQPMPPLPQLDVSLEQAFVDSLTHPIVIKEDDPYETKELKSRVNEVKAYLVTEIKKGESLLELLKVHQAEMERVADNHLMAIREVQKLRKECGNEAAEEFRKAINESFKVRGIPEI